MQEKNYGIDKILKPTNGYLPGKNGGLLQQPLAQFPVQLLQLLLRILFLSLE
jgi:hypothetical protein